MSPFDPGTSGDIKTSPFDPGTGGDIKTSPFNPGTSGDGTSGDIKNCQKGPSPLAILLFIIHHQLVQIIHQIWPLILFVSHIHHHRFLVATLVHLL